MRDKVVQKSSFEGEIVRYYNAFFLDEERLFFFRSTLWQP